MGLQMVFNNSKNQAPAPALRYEMTDFDLRGSVLEAMMGWEDKYFHITREHMASIHLSMKDDDNMEILHEGANDFLKSAAAFIGNMIKRFTELMSKVFTYLQAYIGNFDRFLSKNRDKIDQANPSFRLRGFEYTFDPNIPKMDKLEEIVNTYSRDVGLVQKKGKDELVREREEVTSEEYFSKVRGYVLGTNREIHRDDFLDDVKRIYRDGEVDPKDMIVERDTLIYAASNYTLYKKVLKDCIKERDKAVILLNNLQSFFEKGAMSHYAGDEKVLYAHQLSLKDDGYTLKKTGKYEIAHTNSNVDLYNMYYNYKWKQAKEVGFIMITAITEKVTALKEALKQSERIIRKSVFSQMRSEGSEK